MNQYVGVQNNVALAVSSILKVKKAFRTQMQCIDVLTKQNKSLQEKNCQLEKTNKGLKSKVAKLESDNEKQERIVSDLIRGGTGADVFSDLFAVDNNHVCASQAMSTCANGDFLRVSANSKHKEQVLCPSSPTTSNRQGSKRKSTPKKQTVPRKSRRLSNRDQKS